MERGVEEHEFSADSIAKKYGISLDSLRAEQKKISKAVSLKDSIDFNLADRIAGCDIIMGGNMLIAVIVILDKEMKVLEQQYAIKKAEFPYLPEFRAYRELPVIMECYSKLQESFDVILFEGQGIAHPRKCGLATHFGVITQKPSIGVAQKLLAGTSKNGTIVIEEKIVGIELITKEGSKPIYVSPGNMISLQTAADLVKGLIIKPHKLPEPLVVARKHANRIRTEFTNEKSEF
ncbi:MAG: endonuclease V [archaeon]